MQKRPMETPSDRALAAGILARAFFTDPGFVWIFPDPNARRSALDTLESAFVRMYVPHGACYVVGDPVTAACLWRPPGVQLGTWSQVRAGLLTLPLHIGLSATQRLMCTDREVHAIQAAHAPSGPFWYLDTLGVQPDHQGQGLGGRLLAQVLAERVDPSGLPTTLFTNEPRNLPFYQRHDFRLVHQTRICDGFDAWFMQRG